MEKFKRLTKEAPEGEEDPLRLGTRTEYERIDAVRSVAGMKEALAALAPDFRKKVILHALGASEAQFTWSHMANAFGVPATEWPAAGDTGSMNFPTASMERTNGKEVPR